MLQLYISFVRRRRKMNSYHAWDKYHWNDYLSRTKLAKTFYTRHAPLSRGGKGDFGDLLLDPKCWDETVTTTASAASGTGVKPNQNRKKTKKAGTELMDEWDSDTMEWTPRS